MKKKVLFLCSFIFYFEKTQSGDDVKFSVSECEIFFNILYSQLGQNNCSRDCNERWEKINDYTVRNWSRHLIKLIRVKDDDSNLATLAGSIIFILLVA